MNKARGKMPYSERAKQFMPFAALSGFEEEIAKREQMKIEEMEGTKAEPKE